MGTQLLALLNALAAEFSIDTNRISVTGLSMGGYGVWSLLQQYPAFLRRRRADLRRRESRACRVVSRCARVEFSCRQ